MGQDRDEVLTRFLREPAKEPAPALDDDAEYRAFKAVDARQRRLLIRPRGGSCEWATYQYLLRIVLDPRETRLALIFSFMAVTLSGRRLGSIAAAVADERCDFIQEMDERRWKRPSDPEATVVEGIEFVTDRPPMESVDEMSSG